MNPARPILLAALFAMALKLWWAASSDGTTDVMLFYGFGATIHQKGLLAAYETPLFNHTPIVGSLVGAIYEMANGKGRTFAFLLRAPGIFADFLTVLALLWLRRKTGTPPWWALALFALSPVSLMVSGYHGNVDPLLVCALTLSACCCVGGRAGWSGVALGLACQVKIIALLAAPALAFWWWEHKRAWPFLFAMVLTTLAGWGLPLVVIPEKFAQAVLAYPSYWGTWGISWWLRASGVPAFQPLGLGPLTSTQIAVGMTLKAVIVALTLAVAWRRRHVTVFSTLALTWLVFFVLAPGFGAQYLIWIAPFALVASPSWYLALTVASTVFLHRFYSVISEGLPWVRGTATNVTTPFWAPWTNLPWVVVLAWTAWWGFTAVRQRRSE